MITDEQLLDQITRVRAKNNVNWMELIRIALKSDPKSTREVLSKILICDLEVSRLLRIMANEDWEPRNLDK